jgi:adenosylcobyric acid synthase
MILGSGSDVGKSILVAGLCRVFAQEGVKVAPFKAQNMALNSFITADGGEMGRAQVVQARAAGLEPHVDMNPILLKPSSDVGSQVIVQGRVLGNFSARDYYRLKPRLLRRVMESFRRLAARYELIILEGAGSAVELNLKAHDLVNFAMARRADAQVLLVADIERGGVFAATIGAFHLLTPAERHRLRGFIINKFRGDPALFAEGVKIIARRTRRPVLGVLPYLSDLALPEEDSVALARKRAAAGRDWPDDGRLKVGVIRLPHISNYTDFDPLEREPGVALRYLEAPEELEEADLIILPGSKNTIADLAYLRETGLARQLTAFAQAGGHVLGVCGGYQMLGLEVRDPLGVEGPPGQRAPGLGLLPVSTTMAGEKTMTQVEARALTGEARGAAVTAYEIHMGVTEPQGPGTPLFALVTVNGRPATGLEGWQSPDGRVAGTYLHGLFDSDGFRRAYLAGLARERGRRPTPGSDSFQAFQEEQFNRLADALRQHLDLCAIREMIRK